MSEFVENIRTIETNAATIKFTGNVGLDCSDSESVSESEPSDVESGSCPMKVTSANCDANSSTDDSHRRHTSDIQCINSQDTSSTHSNSSAGIDKNTHASYSTDSSHNLLTGDATGECSHVVNIASRINPFDNEEYDPNEKIFPHLDEENLGMYRKAKPRH